MRGEVGDRTNEATDIPCSFMVTELWLKHKIKSNIYIYIYIRKKIEKFHLNLGNFLASHIYVIVVCPCAAIWK